MLGQTKSAVGGCKSAIRPICPIRPILKAYVSNMKYLCRATRGRSLDGKNPCLSVSIHDLKNTILRNEPKFQCKLLPIKKICVVATSQSSLIKVIQTYSSLGKPPGDMWACFEPQPCLGKFRFNLGNFSLFQEIKDCLFLCLVL
jgi:hypothetical protein